MNSSANSRRTSSGSEQSARHGSSRRNETLPIEVLTGVLEGQESAWADFISHYERRLAGYFRPRVTDPAVAEDLTQETFVAFWTSLPNFDRERPVEPLLFTIAANKLTDWLRREGRRPAIPLRTTADTSGGADQPVAGGRAVSSMARSRERRSDEEEMLAGAVGSLIEKWRNDGAWERLACLEMTVVGGWANRKVASHLQIDEQTVANHKSYALRQIRAETSRRGVTGTVTDISAD